FFILFFLLNQGQIFSQTVIIKKQANEDIKVLSKADSLELSLKKTNLADTTRINLLLAICDELYFTGKYNQALNFSAQAKELSEKTSNKKGIATAIYIEANCLSRKDNYPAALQGYANSHRLFSEINFKQGIANSLFGVGNINMNMGDYKDAISKFSEALKIYSDIKDKKGMAKCYGGIGAVNSDLGNYPEALKNELDNLKISESIGYKRGVAGAYTTMGIIYTQQGNLAEGLKNHLKALKINKEIDYKSGIAAAYNNIGIIYISQSNTDEALKNFLAGLEVRKEIGEKRGIASLYNNIGSVYVRMGNYSESLKSHEAALELNKEMGDKTGIAACYINIANVYTEKGNYADAIKNVEQSLLLHNLMQLKSGIAEDHKLLAIIYDKKKDYKSAYDHYSLSAKLNDSLLNEENSKQINRMQIEYETEKKEKEIALLQKNNELKQKAFALLEKGNEIKKLTIFVLIAGLLFVLILGVFLFQWNRSRQNKKLQAEKLKHQKEQLNAIIQTQEEERKRIAKDLHDGIGQLLAGLKLGWVNIAEEIAVANPLLKEKIKKSSGVLDDAATEVRSLSHQMMPRVLNESGLAPAIEDMLGKSFSGTAIKYDFQHINVEERFSENIEVGLYRITQELISNILKHAGATEINIRLFKNAQNIVLMVEDNGKGFNFAEKKSNGLGLMNIRSRTQLINGEVNYAGGINGGTVVTIRVPLL
ncbi:MAG: sensor histidine kinase, partial [Bacteroidia bacterium]|nr:sensor histidine kinase [Bacteroidia bacterium]